MTIQQHRWDKVLIDGHARLVRARRVFRYLPSAPRCKLCNDPFGGPVGRIPGAAGFSPSRKNPNLCSRCCDALPVGGAEVDIAVLFADVRGSTALGQHSAAADLAALLNRFYVAATRTLLRHDAVIDKLIGDEVMAFFVQGVTGPNYRRRAVQAAMELLDAVGYGSPAANRRIRPRNVVGQPASRGRRLVRLTQPVIRDRIGGWGRDRLGPNCSPHYRWRLTSGWASRPSTCCAPPSSPRASPTAWA
jgi:Adenylate and Guanylate cyclase catalytic domain